MPASQPILAPTTEFDKLVATREEIRAWVPQRHEFEMLDGILHYDEEQGTAVAYKEIGEGEFWVRGHIPGQPLFPGVLMVESAAQLCCYVFCRRQNDHRFFAFGGVDQVRFRGTVHPGDRFVLMARARKIRRMLGVFDTQAFVGSRMVYEGVITGMVLADSR